MTSELAAAARISSLESLRLPPAAGSGTALPGSVHYRRPAPFLPFQAIQGAPPLARSAAGAASLACACVGAHEAVASRAPQPSPAAHRGPRPRPARPAPPSLLGQAHSGEKPA